MYKLRFLLPLLLISIFTLGQDRFPKPTGNLVNDYAGLLNSSQQQRLEEKLLRYTDSTSTEIAVVIIKTLNDEDPNLYAAELGQEWGVGRKGKENGLVFLVAVDDREMAIQNGYGLEPVLTDAKTKLLIEDYIIPHFKRGEYYEGIDEGTDQIFKLLAGEFKGKGNRKPKGRKGIPFFALIVLAIIIISFFRGRGRGGRGGYHGGGGYWIGGFGGGMGGSSGGFGGGGGGFGGFGGGSFGGGGASGSW